MQKTSDNGTGTATSKQTAAEKTQKMTLQQHMEIVRAEIAKESPSTHANLVGRFKVD